MEAFGKMVEGEREEREGARALSVSSSTQADLPHSAENVYVPPGRLVTMLEQAVSYQIELSRYRPKDTPVIHS